MRAPVRRAGLRHRQARQPVRRGRRCRQRRCLRAGLRHRPDQRLRRHHRLQQPAGRRHRQGDPGPPVRRSADCPGLRAGRAGIRAEEGQRARAAHPARRWPEQLRQQARRLGPAAAVLGQPRHDP
ncbi:hypothetical protein G6F64_014833 [Rhizopus arrhizus]|uniref:Uncharacterized protein n=1 Tax=Rhizopus oryzae TaxID=64495 RepID=A0A9P6WTG8_RHIOR|nr:hypothetical protein G6F64_014833 [Rhizopus arrhizus]